MSDPVLGGEVGQVVTTDDWGVNPYTPDETIFDKIGNFIKGFWDGVSNHSIVGNIYGQTKDTLKTAGEDIRSTLNLIPAILIALTVAVVLYIIFMGKRGKALA